jgi:hypothetical protein
MADRYEIVRDKHKVPNKWELSRISDDPEFGFTKKVGTYRTKTQAEAALKSIKAHPDMNFSEWFYGNAPFDGLDIDTDWAARSLYSRWREIGGHLTVDKKRDFMNNIAVMVAMVAIKYEERIDDLKMGFAIELAGEDW